MENPLLTTDALALKELFNEPLYLIKEEFKTNSIIESDSSNVETKQDFQIEIKGDNTKNIVFIVFTDNPNLSELEKSLYDKTITALKLSPTEIGFTSLSNRFTDNFELISSKLSNQKVICYGNSKVYGSNLLQTSIVNSNTFFLCPSLDELSTNNELKIKWWGNLKSFLNL